MKNMKSFKTFALIAVATATTSFSAKAALNGAVQEATIDFESGFSDRQEVPTIDVNGVQVRIGTSSGPAYIAQVGGKTTAFNIKDTPADGLGGDFFVSDQNTTGMDDYSDFVISFSEEVQTVALDAYDIGKGQGGKKGDTVTLNAYDAMNRLIGSDAYTITVKEENANRVTFGVEMAGITRVELVHSGRDGSTGIDNITFGISVAAAPEPAEWAMIVLGALVLGAGFRNRSQATTSQ